MSENLVVKAARIPGNKNRTLSAISLVLMLAIPALITCLPVVSAQTSIRQTAAYLSVAPKVVGVGQQLTVNLWVFPPPAGPYFEGGGVTPYLPSFHNITITFTKPDGSKNTFKPTEGSNIGLAPGETETGGMLWFLYTPDQAGTWSAQFSYPGETFGDYPATNATVIYPPAESAVVTFTVQNEPVSTGLTSGYPSSPLPTDYWTRPVNTDNREWYQISGDWTGNDAIWYARYTTAPSSSHIVWETQVSNGGLVGGIWGSLSYPAGSAGGGVGGGGGSPSVIMMGRVFINRPGSVFDCYDLRTGKLIYEKPGSISRGQHLKAATIAGQGNVLNVEASVVTPYLWELSASGWKQYDPLTGTLLSTITNVPGSTSVASMSDGDPIVYCFRQIGWNTTIPDRYAQNELIKWDYSKVRNLNWTTGIVWNISLKQPDGTGPGEGGRTNSLAIWNDIGVVNTGGTDMLYAFDLTTGKPLWTKQLDHVLALPSVLVGVKGYIYSFDGVTMTYRCYDVTTGNQLWTSDVAGIAPWGSNAEGQLRCEAYNMLYVGAYDGYARAIDIDTGKIKWQFYVGDTNETIYGTWPVYRVSPVADGKVYITTTEHSPTQPRFRFNKMFCLNAYTGEELWNISGAVQPLSIADGYLLASNENDGFEYCFGKGQTSTTITVQNDIVTKGSTIMIKGAVMDKSPAQPDTPAISDADMTAWINYLHMQEPLSTTITGVPVELYAIDPNGNKQEIGTVTSDMSGSYSKMWTPPIEGTYTIVAKFSGSDSYWSSSAETAIGVTAAAPSPSVSAPPPAPSPSPTSVPSPTFVPTTPIQSPSPSEATHPEAGSNTALYVGVVSVVVIVLVVAVAVALRIRHK
ncbi:MAG: hypothetical protein ACE14S_02835 [Candidatus Bathyarchaeia archaeon]